MKKFKFKIRGNTYSTVIKKFENNSITVEINNTSYQVELEKDIVKTKTPRLVRAKVPLDKVEQKDSSKSVHLVKAPIPGTIFKLIAKVGDEINEGDSLLILEAMKMENNIQADVSGKIKAILITEGSSVLQDDILIEIEK